jgi:8-oxo-dGTP diphosphatase
LNNSFEKTKIVEVAAAVLQRPDGSFLLAQRPADKIWAGYWEFPGGKIEPGETPYHALVRELREELGITVATAYQWVTRMFTYPHATVRLNFFRVERRFASA